MPDTAANSNPETYLSTRQRRADFKGPRGRAFEILNRVERAGAFASILLGHAESEMDEPRDAALLHDIVLGVLRKRGLLDHAIDRCASRPTGEMDPDVLTALRIGAYSLLCLDRVPDFAAVDRSVALVGRVGGAHRAGFVNGVLRRMAQLGQESLPGPPQQGDLAALAVAQSHPEWMVRRFVEELGWAEACLALEANNRPAATVLRANPERLSSAELRRDLEADGLACTAGCYDPDAVRLESGSPRLSRALAEGRAWVQDEASQLVPRLFGELRGPLVADLCAAPGTKSMQLAAGLPPGGTVVAADRHPGRLRRLVRLSARLGLGPIWPLNAELGRGAPPFGVRFNEILVDAPCSGTGTLRRRPEIRWRLDEAQLGRFAAQQSRILGAAASILAPGGRLVYSVCSVEPEEGEQVVQRFLEGHAAFRLEDPAPYLPAGCAELIRSPGYLCTSPLKGGLDGFFAARLTRRAD